MSWVSLSRERSVSSTEPGPCTVQTCWSHTAQGPFLHLCPPIICFPSSLHTFSPSMAVLNVQCPLSRVQQSVSRDLLAHCSVLGAVGQPCHSFSLYHDGQSIQKQHVSWYERWTRRIYDGVVGENRWPVAWIPSFYFAMLLSNCSVMVIMNVLHVSVCYFHPYCGWLGDIFINIPWLFTHKSWGNQSKSLGFYIRPLIVLKLSFCSFICQQRWTRAGKSVTFGPTDTGCTDLCSSENMLSPLWVAIPHKFPFCFCDFSFQKCLEYLFKIH